MTSLDIKFRPKTFKRIVGNEVLVRRIESMFNDLESFPSTILLQGPSGCGKTTIARIIAKKLKIEEVHELNIANQRKIDDARSIVDGIRYSSMTATQGKVIILNECFSPDTNVLTSLGNKKISNISIGDQVYNLNGKGFVQTIFKNKILINTIVKVNFKDTSIFCSSDHLFLTNNYIWKMAINLKPNDLTYKANRGIVIDIKLNKLREIIKNVYLKTKMQKLQGCFQKENNYPKILFEKMCRSWNKSTNGVEKKEQQEMVKDDFSKNERKQSYTYERNNRKGKKHKKNKWHSQYMACKTWWQWAIYQASSTFSNCLSLAYGTCNQHGQKKGRMAYFLQSRYREQEIKNSNRSGWPWTQIEEKHNQRQEKTKKTKKIRVESVEIYKQGNNDKSFRSVIGNKERNQGYVEFYDLEIDTHPSYYANNILVHNCHKANNEFQNAMLESLEEPPPNVHFILCTTEPEKLLTTIKTRSTKFQVKRLGRSEIIALVTHVSNKEDINISKSGIRAITTYSDGSPRTALVLLNSVKNIDDPEDMLEVIKDAIESEKAKVEGIELSRSLLKGNSYKAIMKIVSKLEEDPELIRREILKYMTQVLLGGANDKAALIINNFYDDFYSSGKAGLVLSVYNTIQGG